MSMAGVMDPNEASPGAWQWWEGRRLRYNIALALAGWAAYGVDIALFYAFHRPSFASVQGAVAMTLFLGTLFLVVMFVANIFYLLGATTESLIAPANREAFRKQAFSLGLWGSVALPFVFPLANLAMLIAGGPFAD